MTSQAAGNHSIGEDGDLECLWTMESDGDIERRIHYWIVLVVFPVLLLQGIVGNILAMPILRSISCSSWSTVSYLMVVSAADLFILLVRCGDEWYMNLTNISLSKRFMDFSDAVCRTYSFLFTFTTHLTPWLIVAMSVEMMIATRWPKLTYTMCTIERSKYVMLFFTILLVCLDINQFWTMGIPKPELGCGYTEEFSESFRDWIWPAMSNAVEHGIPLLVVTICFCVTASTLIRRTVAHQRSLEDELNKYFLELSTIRDFRTVCLVVCLIFMCLAAMKVILAITDMLIMYNYIVLTCQGHAQYIRVTAILRIFKRTFSYTFYCTKVYIYLFLSTAFRHRLNKMFLKISWKLKKCAKHSCGCRQQWAPIALHDNNRDTSQCPRTQALDLEMDSTDYNHVSDHNEQGMGLTNEPNTISPSYKDVINVPCVEATQDKVRTNV